MMMKFRKNKKQEGQAIAEFALLLPILVLFIAVGIQFAILLNTYVSMTHVARAGARFASTNFSDDSDITTYVQSAVVGILDPSKVTVTVSPGEGTTFRTSGYPITVNIGYDMRYKMFIPSSFKLGSFTLGIPTQLMASATMRIN